MRAAEPRASSSASGFRFCGIMLEPLRVTVAELHEAELARAVDDQILGEPREVRRRSSWSVNSTSATKSRSLDRVDASSARRASKPSVPWSSTRETGIRAAGDGAGAEREHGRGARRGAQACAVALERPEVREQPVRRRHRLARCRCVYDGMSAVCERLAPARAARCCSIAHGGVERAGRHPSSRGAWPSRPGRCGCGPCAAWTRRRRPRRAAGGRSACARPRRTAMRLLAGGEARGDGVEAALDASCSRRA